MVRLGQIIITDPTYLKTLICLLIVIIIIVSHNKHLVGQIKPYGGQTLVHGPHFGHPYLFIVRSVLDYSGFSTTGCDIITSQRCYGKRINKHLNIYTSSTHEQH